jgi:phosphoribosyl-AMP cyclohydrolase / phosphoribosyl-ATP pyrophosphohydrolase
MLNIEELAWDRMAGLLPAIVQHADTGEVLMLGYMDRAALYATLAEQQIIFYSRSKQRLWRKGETSGNTLQLIKVVPDCDQDALLILAIPHGPTCHLNTASCFKNAVFSMSILSALEQVINERKRSNPEGSYVRSLFDSGVQRIAQKVGEEAVETALAAVSESTETFCEEMADLLFHMQVLVVAKGLSLSAIVKVLQSRM